MATMNDVAAVAGVSGATVSRVVNGIVPVNPTTRRRVEQAIRQVGYQHNKVARSLAGGRTMTIGLAVPIENFPVFGSITSAVVRAATQHRFAVLIGEWSEDPEQHGKTVTMFLEHRVEGIVIAGQNLCPAPEFLANRTPIVHIETNLEPNELAAVENGCQNQSRLSSETVERLLRRIRHPCLSCAV
ncbi:LacI family DNA-binding transcriptional regulator [Arthrobacter sp. NtRootA1]|uniref:LacI family DNA-binding transcriptional regulator n=1 Tax=Arthrobacter sp. NtRootA1 TaxID=2830983 RepID=UPI001CC6CF51|nr:LacI family DNA-binding transcriptional regulator [Arthrobacter sp. NtRootA1]BCW05692.1 hypothetical protein NtRootA1_18300 [Arthrobacter sp. NtRootA1]